MLFSIKKIGVYTPIFYDKVSTFETWYN